MKSPYFRYQWLQTSRRTPCSHSIPVSSTPSGPPSKATYRHDHRTPTRWAATDHASPTATASPASCSGWSAAAPGTSPPDSPPQERPPCATGAPNGSTPASSAKLVEESIAGYDRIIGLDLSEVAVDGSLHKAPCGGEGTGPNPTDRAKIGWKWSIATDLFGIPIGWVVDGANRNDSILLAPTLQTIAERGLLLDVETLHLDRGYDSLLTTGRCHAAGLTDIVCAKKRRKGEPKIKKPLTLSLRWPVERTNSWLSNFGQLRRNTDRSSPQRLGQIALAIALILTVKLVKWAKRWTD